MRILYSATGYYLPYFIRSELEYSAVRYSSTVPTLPSQFAEFASLRFGEFFGPENSIHPSFSICPFVTQKTFFIATTFNPANDSEPSIASINSSIQRNYVSIMQR